MPSKPVTIQGMLTWENGGGSPPLGIWGGGNVPMPTPPIYLLPPDAIRPGVPAHPIYLPVYPAHPIVIPPSSVAPGVPAHPIVIPPGIWGGANEGFPTHPIVIPPIWWDDPKPEHPIVLPPYQPPCNCGGGEGIWGGGNVPMPTPPIVIPPDFLAPGVPAHPIFLPPTIWGPNDPRPTPPIHIPPGAIAPGVPTHPIVLPPLPLPPGIWGGSGEPFPTPPIVIPPDLVAPGVPAHPIYLPPQIWGPHDPRPSQPIVLPGDPSWEAPPDIIIPPFPGGDDDGVPVHPVAGIPGPNGLMVFYWTPAWGWVAVPAGGPGSLRPINPPGGGAPPATPGKK